MNAQHSLVPIKCLTAVMTLGSSYYAGNWLLGRIDSGAVLNELFQQPPAQDYSPREIILYKNYVIGLLFVPNLSLLAALVGPSRRSSLNNDTTAIGMASLSGALANGLYSLHLCTIPAPAADFFQPNIRVSAAISHGIVAGICAYTSWFALQ